MAAAVAPIAGPVLSAGFVLVLPGGLPHCLGHSTSLHMGTGATDSHDLAVTMGLSHARPTQAAAALQGAA
jgi:hypothetical protein